MRTLRLFLVGAVLPALLAGPGGSVVAEDLDAFMATFVDDPVFEDKTLGAAVVTSVT